MSAEADRAASDRPYGGIEAACRFACGKCPPKADRAIHDRPYGAVGTRPRTCGGIGVRPCLCGSIGVRPCLCGSIGVRPCLEGPVPALRGRFAPPDTDPGRKTAARPIFGRAAVFAGVFGPDSRRGSPQAGGLPSPRPPGVGRAAVFAGVFGPGQPEALAAGRGASVSTASRRRTRCGFCRRFWAGSAGGARRRPGDFRLHGLPASDALRFLRRFWGLVSRRRSPKARRAPSPRLPGGCSTHAPGCGSPGP